ncbi:MAG TPA: NAD(P)/FAD-dependent oxidoreductase [Bryobacteraceae bacterium]|nr:NAD(P)/FAD-dependent oxidoreductase [Bryobacteraceae bacterium]
MDACDVLIVGGGPAGSSCAWKLRDSGLDVVVLDKQVFPRDKVCGGWITPAVLSELEIDEREYDRGRIFQPITGFRVGRIGGATVDAEFGKAVSYGIRRREFDEYLLRRSGARCLEGINLTNLERRDGEWIANGELRARLVVGAGGHFCPVARLTGAKSGGEQVVVAQEAEFEMDTQQRAGCAVLPELPELYFCFDLKGYGWCFRKGNFLNVGLGRMDQHRLSEHVSSFLRFLKSAGRVSFEIPHAALGHAYLLYDASARKIADDGTLLIGDAAGLAYSQSGEGIRPAIESGLLAAKAIVEARGKYDGQSLEVYRTLLAQRFGAREHWATKLGRHLPSGLIQLLGERLLGMRWFAREVVIDRWFLHAGEPTLEC